MTLRSSQIGTRQVTPLMAPNDVFSDSTCACRRICDASCKFKTHLNQNFLKTDGIRSRFSWHYSLCSRFRYTITQHMYESTQARCCSLVGQDHFFASPARLGLDIHTACRKEGAEHDRTNTLQFVSSWCCVFHFKTLIRAFAIGTIHIRLKPSL